MTDGSGDETADGDVPAAVPPRQVLAEDLASMRDLLSRASAFVAIPEPSVLVDDVRSRPPHERFQAVARDHAERLGATEVTPAGIEDLVADLPVDDPMERATTFLVRRAGRLQGRLLGQLAREPERPREYLVLAVAAGHLQRAAADCQHAYETGDGDLAHHASVVLALAAALFALAEDGLGAPADRDPAAAATDDPLPEWFLREVALADHHRTLAAGDDPATDPLSRDRADLEHLLVVQGAAFAVTELDADPAAVAELADLPLEHLVGVLASE
ncbi:hypothetical protein G9C85_04955 [Halorubellus sp. JP-L1]|uniref:hypothetical protein n=1 Tax=Halorubellus sp. JP-L1 TaxID=2715753 RepID=UPI00140B1375|nr:hypothetical protein [Halorubellus sp. JP-L1]NHN40986.1 hypothetical protein [Halorubellus sp. JP-L1]